MVFDIVIIGGGASGFFTAVNAVKMQPNLKILILERGKEVLQKVKISGGGRCNVTHAEFIPNELTKNYPRGNKELKGPFHKFSSGDVMQWFDDLGVPLKIENDGRVFPVSNSSQTIIDCFLQVAKQYNIQILTSQLVTDFVQQELNNWKVITKTKQVYKAKNIVIATGSQSKMWQMLEKKGLKNVSPVSSLFTFNCNDTRMETLPGISTRAKVAVKGQKLENVGPVLVTHWGFSGPAILKLSAWGARKFHECGYKFKLVINWTLDDNFEECRDYLESLKQLNSSQIIFKNPLYDLPKRLWQQIVIASKIQETQQWANVSKKQINALSNQLTQATFDIDGKSTFKEEFVTAGGVDLKEVDFKTFKSKKLPNCYIVGEALNIDAVTGGFNFQNAWTSGYLAALAISNTEENA